MYPLAGKSLTIGIHKIQLSIPAIRILQPYSVLKSRITVIKGFSEPENFLEAAQKQLNAREISGRVTLLKDPEGNPKRNTIKIKRFTIVGFGLKVEGLNEKDSLELQATGLGGKRRMGCGVFYGDANKVESKAS